VESAADVTPVAPTPSAWLLRAPPLTRAEEET